LITRELNVSELPSDENPNFRWQIAFMGSRQTHRLRWPLTKGLTAAFGDKFLRSWSPDPEVWQTALSMAKLALVPRGFGRNSYQMTQVLQLALVPVYVYNDLVWLPYYDSINWADLAVIVHMDNLSTLVQIIRDLAPSTVVKMRKRLVALHQPHFTAAGIWHHLLQFLKFGFRASGLPCSTWLHHRGA
jgi:hypothetical protein